MKRVRSYEKTVLFVPFLRADLPDSFAEDVRPGLFLAPGAMARTTAGRAQHHPDAAPPN